MQRVLSHLRRAVEKYDMIESGDKIAVGVSGGKDSLVLLCALHNLKMFYSKPFSIQAIIVDLFNGKSNYSSVIELCNKLEVPVCIVPSTIYEVVFEDRKEKNPCSLCAKLRRGILNSKAVELGCNKVALGHHADDLIETFYLSLIYEGRLSTFHPVSYLSETHLTVIRPLILTPEKLITAVANKLQLPIFNNCCPANHKTQREYMKNYLANLEADIPFAKDRILSAITETERYNMFNKK